MMWQATRLLLQIPDAGTMKYSYAADGTLLTEIDAWGKQTVVVNTIGYNRGYTGHEMMPEFGLINMNGRVYDPNLGRFLSPDNYVQMPDNSQNFNRYSYCLNNPLKYTDPSGEFVHLLIGAAIGGFMNWCVNGCQFNAKGLASFGIGAVAGALGAGVGGGISSCLPVAGSSSGGFAAGFWGTQAATTATSSFFSGFLTGCGAGASAGLVEGAGNALLHGENVWHGAATGALYGGLIGGTMGGIYSGFDAMDDGRRFWDGAEVEKFVIDQHNTIVGQIGNQNCVGACCQSASDGKVSQHDVRANWDRLLGEKTDPNKKGMRDLACFKYTANQMGPQYYADIMDVDEVWNCMLRCEKVGITYSVKGWVDGVPVKGNHTVLMNKCERRIITSISGKVKTSYRYWVMDPASGGTYHRFNFNYHPDVTNVLRITNCWISK